MPHCRVSEYLVARERAAERYGRFLHADQLSTRLLSLSYFYTGWASHSSFTPHNTAENSLDIRSWNNTG